MARYSVFAGFMSMLFLVFAAGSDAAKVKVWQHNNQGNYDKAQFKQAVVSSEGTLRLSKQLKLLANIQAAHVWDIIEDRAGNLIVATGVEGKIFKVSPDGKTDIIYASGDSQVLCLAQGPDGSIFAGTGPRGTVVRIAADKTTVIAEELEGRDADPEKGKDGVSPCYVWSLAYDPQSKLLYAGTGPSGKIYQVQPDGKFSVFYKTKQDHILRLAVGNKGTLFAGTDKGGMVYRIEPRGKGFRDLPRTASRDPHLAGRR